MPKNWAPFYHGCLLPSESESRIERDEWVGEARARSQSRWVAFFESDFK